MIQNKMKIFIITQEDSFVIPKNIKMLIDSDFIEIIGICIINSKNSLARKGTIRQNFSIDQVIKMSTLVLYNKLLDLIDIIFRAKLLKDKKSVKSICLKKIFLFIIYVI